MKKVAWPDQTSWDEVLKQCEREDIVLTRGGHAVALLSPFNDEDLYWYRRESDPAFIESIAVARRQVVQGKTISHADLKRELGIHLEGTAMSLDQVLDLLDQFHQRATYTAVAHAFPPRKDPRNFLKDRPKDRRHSWVVAKKNGQPTGFPERLRHRGPPVRAHVIAKPEELRLWLSSPQ